MLRVISLLLFLASPALGDGMFCEPDGTLKPHNIRGVKFMAMHLAHQDLSQVDVKKLAESFDITYTLPACDAEGHILPWDQLHVVLTPK